MSHGGLPSRQTPFLDLFVAASLECVTLSLHPHDRAGETTAGQSKPSGSRARRVAMRLAKGLLTLFVLVFVVLRAAELWQSGTAGEINLHVGWLVFSGVLYTVAWLPSTWYWKTLVARMGDRLTWQAAIRAYYCGQLGKYVPGKALVPVIRGQMTATAGGRFRVGALAAVYETLLMMAVGGGLALGLLPALLPENLSHVPPLLRPVVELQSAHWLIEHPWVLAAGVGLLAIATAPLVGKIFAVVTRKLIAMPEAASLTRQIDTRTVFEGGAVLTLGWIVHGLALWSALRGVGAAVSLDSLPTWTACVALPVVVGFAAVFAPGGLGIREGLMIELLQVQSGIDPRQAIATAFVMRLVGLIAEVVSAVVVYYGLADRRAARPARTPPGADTLPSPP